MDACPVDTCGGEEITCTSTCIDASFGEDGCLVTEEVKRKTCAAKTPCGKFHLYERVLLNVSSYR